MRAKEWKAKKVYVVTSGEYDDYSIVGVCSTKKIADKMVEANDASCMFKDARIEEYEMDVLNKYEDGKLYKDKYIDGKMIRLESDDEQE